MLPAAQKVAFGRKWRVWRGSAPLLSRGCAHPMMQAEILRVESLKKEYRSGTSRLVIFENLSFQVRKGEMLAIVGEDRKSTRLNSSHPSISYAVFCLKKKT